MSDLLPVTPAKLFFLPNLADPEGFVKEMEGFPWEATIGPRPGLKPNATKDDYSKWSVDPALDWVFFSVHEGLTPGLRVCKNNPALLQHGLVADYDAKMDMPTAMKVIQDNAPAGLLPTAVGETFSGHIRVVWMFEEPIVIDKAALYETFYKEAFNELRATKLAPGFDSASERTQQYFEIGNGWQVFPGSKPISLPTLSLWLAKAFLKLKDPFPEHAIVPYDRINQEIDKQFPGRVQTPVAEGQSVPLFWLNDGIDRLGATMGEKGVLVWSTREHRTQRGLLSWDKVFGPQFMKEFEVERVGRAITDIWWDKKTTYWAREMDEWRGYSKDDVRVVLKTDFKLSPKPGSKTDPSSEIDKAVRMIQTTKNVDGAGFFPFIKTDIVRTEDGCSFVNCSKVSPMQPAEEATLEQFPWLARYFGIVDDCPGIWDQTVDDAGIGQRDYFLAWLQHFYSGALSGEPTKGHAVFLAGDVNVGKSFLSIKIMEIIAGGKADATPYLTGDTKFNADLAKVGYWTVNDSTISTETQRVREGFASRVKEFVANPTLRVEGKFKDSYTTDFSGRLLITLNTTEQGLSIIPPLEDSIRDKLMLLKCGDWRPEFKRSYKENELMVRKELPFFLRWLLDWEPPRQCLHDDPNHRFYVKEFIHPEIAEHSREMDTSTAFLQDINDMRLSGDALFERGDTEWRGTSGELLERLSIFRPSARYSTVGIGRWLSSFARTSQVPWIRKERGCANRTFFIIQRSSDQS